MKLTRPSRRQPGETIIPLIDVVFFLLVFAMLSGRMDATAPFDMVPPVAQTGDDLAAGGLTLTVGPTGDLALDGVAADRTEAMGAIGTTLFRNGTDTLIRVNADREARLRDVLPLVAAVEALGATNVVFVVTTEAP